MSDYQDNKHCRVELESIKKEARKWPMEKEYRTWLMEYAKRITINNIKDLTAALENQSNIEAVEINIEIDPNGEISTPYPNVDKDIKTESMKEVGQASNPHPPSDADFLVRVFLSADEGEALIGDLSERYTKLYDTWGEFSANRWYYRQILCSVWSLGKQALVRVVKSVINRDWIRRNIS